MSAAFTFTMALKPPAVGLTNIRKGKGEFTMFNVGDEIVYVPDHAEGDPKHPDCEHGFITAVYPEDRVAMCRFFRRGTYELRTVSNGERAAFRNLMRVKLAPPGVIDQALRLVNKHPQG